MPQQTAGPERCAPPIRWAGGKRLLVALLQKFLPQTYNRYYEPMVGSGALFFALGPGQAVLGDINCDLMNLYQVLRSRAEEFAEGLRALRASRTGYYRVRSTCPDTTLDRAIRFFYLIRLSWNGIYRVNQRGGFNVPFGGRRPRVLIAPSHLSSVAQRLRAARFRCGDFISTTQDSQAGDLIYFDPPYPRGAAGNGFARYTPLGFTVKDKNLRWNLPDSRWLIASQDIDSKERPVDAVLSVDHREIQQRVAFVKDKLRGSLARAGQGLNDCSVDVQENVAEGWELASLEAHDARDPWRPLPPGIGFARFVNAAEASIDLLWGFDDLALQQVGSDLRNALPIEGVLDCSDLVGVSVWRVWHPWPPLH